MAFLFFLALLFMIVFLPEINALFTQRRTLKEQEENATITTGTLSCTMNTNDDRFDFYNANQR